MHQIALPNEIDFAGNIGQKRAPITRPGKIKPGRDLQRIHYDKARTYGDSAAAKADPCLVD